jgi:hypothetical protein
VVENAFDAGGWLYGGPVDESLGGGCHGGMRVGGLLVQPCQERFSSLSFGAREASSEFFALSFGLNALVCSLREMGGHGYPVLPGSF